MDKKEDMLLLNIFGIWKYSANDVVSDECLIYFKNTLYSMVS